MALQGTGLGVRVVAESPVAAAAVDAFNRAVLQNRRVSEFLSGHRWRLLHSEPISQWNELKEQHETHECESVFFDYTRNVTLRVRGRLAAPGAVLLEPSYEQPLPSEEEFQEAVALVRQSAVWGPLLAGAQVLPYHPMPGILQPDESGQPVDRTLYVGLVSKPRRFNRIVAVNMIRRQVSREPVVPKQVRVEGMTCGVPEVACAVPRRGTPGSATLSWPAANPVWQMRVIRPSSSSGKNGSGVDLKDVRYRGSRVFKEAHMPILNVQYDQDACGPFRDWLWQETCFDAVGTDVAPGIRMCTEAPRTILDTGRDGGNFVGVAIFENPDQTLLVTSVTRAGWYRYVMSWIFHLDGRIEPRFGFDGVANSCVCRAHNHHGLWRFDFDVVQSSNVVEELNGADWTRLRTETRRLRAAEGAPRWRVRDTRSNAGYEILSGEEDGVGDAFSGQDFYALRYKSRELDDGRTLFGASSTALDRFVGRESLTGDVVVWYGAHFRHVVEEEPAVLDHDHSSLVGPTLVPFNWPTSPPRR
ncbi:MAG: hypothetical protein FJX77_03790 [Armatimonadetes bacterium]|nr:hypothetical protein [Armatimonadota bacterium]